jgi:hypothetical protein
MSSDETDHDRILKLEGNLLSLRVLIEERFAAHKIALDKAESAMNMRLEAMNEFRAQITSERGDYVKKDMLDQRLNPLEGSRSYNRGRDATLYAVLAMAVAAVGTVLTLIRSATGH